MKFPLHAVVVRRRNFQSAGTARGRFARQHVLVSGEGTGRDFYKFG